MTNRRGGAGLPDGPARTWCVRRLALSDARITSKLVPGWVLALLLVIAPAAAVQAQEPVPPPAPATRADSLRADSLRADSLRAAADTIPFGRDSIPADSASRPRVDWLPADSVMQSLMSRQGYTVTRYQGAVVGLDARTNTLLLEGDSADRAAVNRGDSTLVIGNTIRFNDSTQVVEVRGDTVYLEDPTQNIIARGRLVYDVVRRHGLVTNLCTTVENAGFDWFVCGEQAAIVGDTSGTSGSRFYAHDSRFTTCDLDVPHYHFEARNVKVIQDRLLVGRPAVMYVEGVPVAWFPFFFQDLRRGRRSGFLPPRLGVATFVRSGSDYRRSVDNVGYYFALSDYMDAKAWLDWRSGARPTEGDPGYMRYTGQLRYTWLNRFMSGELGVAYTSQNDGTRMQQYSWGHRQSFSANTNLNFNLNYTTNTTIQRNNALHPGISLATIRSNANFQQKRGPFSYSIGGTAAQYPGRDAKDIQFPNFSLSSTPLSVGEWLVWNPRVSLTNQLSLDEQLSGVSGLQLRPRPDGGVDSVRVQADRRRTTLSFGTPLRIFGWDWQNDFTINDTEDDFPQMVQVVDTLSPTGFQQRLYSRTYFTSLDWRTSFSLPSLFQGTWNLTPSVSVQNVEPGAGFMVRSERTGTKFVTQSKRLVYGVGISPTFFRLYPGVGPFERFRHAVQLGLNYDYSPSARVSDEFLAAIGRDPRGYLGALPQSQLRLSVNTNIEARYRRRTTPGDSTTTAAQSSSQEDKIRLLTLNLSSLGYDFYKADSTGNGLTNQSFNYTVRSDLLPGFDLSVDYDLFRGSVLSDTAEFDPYRTNVRASLNLDARSPLVRGVASLFGVDLGRRTTATDQISTLPESDLDPLGRERGQSIVGRENRLAMRQIPSGDGWRLSLTYSSSRRRPVTGENVIIQDPAIECAPLQFNPAAFEQCLERVRLNPPDDALETPGTIGRPIFVSPSLSSVSGSLAFNLTPRWAANWSTSYDFTTNEFATHVVTLQRELHDWMANFSFTRTPMGAFAFSFFISLKAEPDFKFDYNRQSYRSPSN